MKVDWKKGLKQAYRGITGFVTAGCLLLLCINLYGAAAKRIFSVPCPTVFGYTYAVVVSGSMSGSIEVNDIVVIHRQDSYRPGDVISFQSGSALVTHRICRETAEGFVTRGDANDTEDPEPVEQSRIVGRVVHVIPGAGSVIRFLHTPGGMACLFLAAMLVLLLPVPGRKRG